MHHSLLASSSVLLGLSVGNHGHTKLPVAGKLLFPLIPAATSKGILYVESCFEELLFKGTKPALRRGNIVIEQPGFPPHPRVGFSLGLLDQGVCAPIGTHVWYTHSLVAVL